MNRLEQLVKEGNVLEVLDYLKKLGDEFCGGI